jgi:hypothetical protein
MLGNMVRLANFAAKISLQMKGPVRPREPAPVTLHSLSANEMVACPAGAGAVVVGFV